MAAWNAAHLLFCEGPHDVAFLNRVLKTQLGFRQEVLQISALPYPLSNVLKQSFQRRAAEDLRLDLAKKFFLPDQVLARDGVLVLLFNYGGSNRGQSLPPFLADVLTLLATNAFSGDTLVPLSYVVFADADASSTAAVQVAISTDLASIDGKPWLTSGWQPLADLPMAAEQHTQQGRVGAYVWRSQEADQGTLEDIVMECLTDETHFAETLKFVANHFDWMPSATATPQQVCKLNADRRKAAFCVEGQRKKPGGSLGVVLDQANLLTSDRLASSVSAQHCVSFLRRWFALETQ